MGVYVETADKPKWLEDNSLAIQFNPPTEHYDFAHDAYWVVLIDNGFFFAAGITYSARELEAFTYPDPRPKIWFLVPAERLTQVSDLTNYLKG
jgi:hypothetical protein